MDVDRRLSLHFLEAHPDDAARVLERLPVDATAALLEQASPELVAAVLGQMERGQAAACLSRASVSLAPAVLGTLPPRDAAHLLRLLVPTDREHLLARTDGDVAERLRELLRYPENSAGELMEPLVLTLPETMTVAEARERVRRQSLRVRYYLYVTDAHHRLAGVLTLRELALASAKESVSALARRPVLRLLAEDGPAAILAHPGWRQVHSLPVVDETERLIGVLRYETLRRLEGEARPAGPPPLSTVAVSVGQVYVAIAAALLEGVAGSIDAARRRGRKEADDGR